MHGKGKLEAGVGLLASLRTGRVGELPGRRLASGIALSYLSLLVLLPLGALVLRASGISFDHFREVALSPRALTAYRLSFGTALMAATINVVLGLLTGWVLSRYSFPGRRFLDALVDLPFALPTAVAGLTLTTLYGPRGPLGAPLQALGVDVVFQPAGIVLALVFVGFPFVVRSLQPVLAELPASLEEVAATLGATPAQTFRWVIFPHLRGPLLTGFTLALARGVGEYGSVVFISGNMPFKTEIAPLLVVGRLEQYDYEGATAIALVLLCFSLLVLVVINTLGPRRRHSSDAPARSTGTSTEALHG
jgi:sulfate transport system permease protein